ncbi:uncharacterized protein LOC110458958 [Mizuhopecten yessoensis]|uniref:Uncharacterized protein n=1 Tax=Mizuhopecten yessoensis TaxID=6573 RepID=A0A210Q5J6_MIZYE|nr:uncharacterized protein LOC110458958 [Mizuhopecten yessoensis]OWF43998.1 hypothetical protein KP79_PYT11675 [Mizuhopecten yessoensis]
MAPVRVMLGVVVSCLLLGLTRAQGCAKDINMEGNVLFERMTHVSDAVVSGKVLSIGSGREASVQLDCIYKTDGSRTNRDITVLQRECPFSDLEVGMKYLMFMEKTSEAYALRYTAFEADIISEVAAVCGLQRTHFTNDEDACPRPEDPPYCIQYPTPTTAGKPDPDATPSPEPETQKPDVDVVVGGQEATPEPEGDGGTNAATTNFLSCALSLLSFVLSLLML